MKYYEILDLPPTATDEQIRAAYRILVQLHHPDRLQQVSPAVRAYAEERLKKINEAYGVLGDPERRAAYDATLRQSPSRAAEAYAATYEEPEKLSVGMKWVIVNGRMAVENGKYTGVLAGTALRR